MPDASGTPTSPDNIPTYNTGIDPPSGKGFNTAMAQIQSIITQLKAGTLGSGKILASALSGIIPTANLGSGTANSGTFLRGDQSWVSIAPASGAYMVRLAKGTKTSNVAAAGTTFAAGTDVLAAALSFTADGSSSYHVTISAPDIRNTTGGVNDTELHINLDGADAGLIASSFLSGAASNSTPLFARGIITPSAGVHTVNVRMFVAAGNGIIDAGVGGLGALTPIVVTVELH